MVRGELLGAGAVVQIVNIGVCRGDSDIVIDVQIDEFVADGAESV